ncbi:MAG: MbnP family protein [Woeseiaceae bacterium]|nr:MbnP family protein [Woeseiaceae bacterium]
MPYRRPARLAAALFTLTALFAAPGCEPPREAVEIRFDVRYDGRSLRCGTPVQNGDAAIELADLRFFVAAPEFVAADGTTVPLLLDDGSVWQSPDVALIDLEDASGACINGTPFDQRPDLGDIADR